MSTATLEKVVREVQQLPSFPASALRILQCLSDDEVTVDGIVQELSKDLGLVTRLLRVANSSFFGMAQHVLTLNEAVITLGFSNLSLIVVAATLPSQKQIGGIESGESSVFFRHGLATAASAKVLGRRRMKNRNTLFLAGLLHDVGTLALMVVCPDLYVEVHKRCDSVRCSMQKAEIDIFGFDHAIVGAALCSSWNFPDLLIRGIERHHQLDEMVANSDSMVEYDVLAATIRAADVIADALYSGDDLGHAATSLPKSIWQLLGIPDEEISADLAEIRRLYDQLSGLANE